MTWEINELHPSDQGTFVAVLRFESAARVLTLDAAIRAGTPDADESNNAATAKLTFEPDLTLTVLHAPSAVAQGDTANLALLYGNAGNGDAEQVSIRLSLPTGLTFVSAIGGRYDADKRIIVWDLDRVRPHEENHIEASVRVDVESGRLPLSAVIAAVETERVTYNNRADMSLAALPEDVSGRTVWSPGQTFRDSFETLGDVARGTVDLLIWVSTFGVPLAVIVGVVLVPVMLIRRRRDGRPHPPAPSPPCGEGVCGGDRLPYGGFRRVRRCSLRCCLGAYFSPAVLPLVSGRGRRVERL